MPKRHLRIAVLVAAHGLASLAPAQDTKALTKQLENAVATDPAFDSATDALLDAGPAGARIVARVVAKRSESAHRDFAREQKKLLRKFQKAASRITKKAARAAAREIEADRDTILANARDPNLTKATIVAESDPALARLRSHLVASREAVFEADEKLQAEFAALDASLEAMMRFHEAWVRAVEILAVGDVVDPVLEKLDTPPAGDTLRADLERAIELEITLAVPMGSGDAKTLRSNEALRDEIQPGEAEGTRALNRLRLVLGLNALDIDVKLCNACRGHSQDMQRLGFFSHTSPVEGKETFGQRASKAGTSARSENIARGHRTGPSAIRGWWHSPGHHRNMLGSHGRTGLGREQGYWTQCFG